MRITAVKRREKDNLDCTVNMNADGMHSSNDDLHSNVNACSNQSGSCDKPPISSGETGFNQSRHQPDITEIVSSPPVKIVTYSEYVDSVLDTGALRTVHSLRNLCFDAFHKYYPHCDPLNVSEMS